MFGTDEFGNNRLIPFTFAIVFAALGMGLIVTSQTMWGTSDPVVAGVLQSGG